MATEADPDSVDAGQRPDRGTVLQVGSRFAPPLALMGMIFALSAQPDLNSGLGTIDLIGRKFVHMAEYGLLFLLWSRAFEWRRPLAAAAISIAYAATDEWHQTFVYGRHGAPVDVLIDSVGIALAYCICSRQRAVRHALSRRRP